MIMWTLAVLLH